MEASPLGSWPKNWGKSTNFFSLQVEATISIHSAELKEKAVMASNQATVFVLPTPQRDRLCWFCQYCKTNRTELSLLRFLDRTNGVLKIQTTTFPELEEIWELRSHFLTVWTIPGLEILMHRCPNSPSGLWNSKHTLKEIRFKQYQ